MPLKRDPKMVFYGGSVHQIRPVKRIGDAWHISLPKMFVEIVLKLDDADEENLWVAVEGNEDQSLVLTAVPKDWSEVNDESLLDEIQDMFAPHVEDDEDATA